MVLVSSFFFFFFNVNALDPQHCCRFEVFARLLLPFPVHSPTRGKVQH